mmetsp:Transcript_22306/g.33851  ORF Transcript_22306/g.33851 Transcript_22306/m.33851 type:complete len:103 (+) Transcript_22306:118-426(+)
MNLLIDTEEQSIRMRKTVAMTNTLYYENAAHRSGYALNELITDKSEKKSMFESIFRKRIFKNDKPKINVVHVSREDKINSNLARKLSKCSSKDSKDSSAFCC